jgi:nucleoside-diphosphate-sugar epimerase
MKLLITGADRPLGREVAAHFAGKHETRLCGFAPFAAAPAGYQAVDLRAAGTATALVAGMDAIVHVAEFEPMARPHLDMLEHASLGVYQLFTAARAAGVDRVVLVSRLSFFDAYPADYLIDEMWRPIPATEPAEMAPFYAEVVAREFCHEGGVRCVCLRFLPIGNDAEKNTRQADALEAIERALALPFSETGYRWQVYHVTASPRFITRDARLLLGYSGQGV